jgi:hypothetical protein
VRIIRDQAGASALEFGLIGVIMFTLIFAIFDIGRYTITLYSLRMLADESARQEIICYSPFIAANNLASATCSGDPLSAADKQALAPFLFLGGLQPTVATSPAPPGVGPRTVTASQPSYTMLFPFSFLPIGTNGPSVSINLPF